MAEINPLISIVIPVYNIAEFLGVCLDSVVKQTYSHLEIILIDDGSTDGSGEICEKYANKDHRITVVHTENQGAAQARNTGIALTHGEYVMFVDGDDWLDTDICQVLLNAINEHDVDSSMCSYVREYPNKSLPKVICGSNKIFSGKEIQRKLCGPMGDELKHPENMECFNSLCAKLFPRSSVIGNKMVSTDILGTSEDLLFNLKAFASIDSMAYIERPCYHYRKEVHNSITSKYKQNLAKQWDNLYDMIQEIITEDRLDKVCFVAFENRIALSLLGLGMNCVNDSVSLLEKCRRLKEITSDVRRKTALKHLVTKDMPIHWRVFYFCGKYNLVVLLSILLFFIKIMKGKF